MSTAPCRMRNGTFLFLQFLVAFLQSVYDVSGLCLNGPITSKWELLQGDRASHFLMSQLRDNGAHLLSVAALSPLPSKKGSYQFIFLRR